MPDMTVSLSQEDWMKVLNLLAEQPFKVVAPIIGTMQKQLQQQAAGQEQQ